MLRRLLPLSVALLATFATVVGAAMPPEPPVAKRPTVSHVGPALTVALPRVAPPPPAPSVLRIATTAAPPPPHATPTAVHVPSTTPPAAPRVDPYAGFKIAPKLPMPKDERHATVLTYLMNDQPDHQDAQSKGMLDMMKTNTPKGIHSVVFRDGHEIGDARIYYMHPGSTESHETPGESLLAPGVKEVQSNHPKVVSQIVKFAFDNYDSKHRYLEIYTHGGGVSGIGMDSVQTDPKGAPIQGNRLISVADFGEALRTGLHGRSLDGIYFRACLMSNVEALYELRGTTKYAIASELVSSSVDNSNLTMTSMFQDLAAKDTPPEQIVREMAIQGHGKTGALKDGARSGYDSIIAADIGKIGDLKSSLNRLVQQIKAAPETERAAVAAAYDATGSVDGNMGDLWKFTSQLQKQVKSPGVLEAVAGVRSAQRDVMIHARDNRAGDVGGLSIFMPKRTEISAAMKKESYAANAFAKDTGWSDLLLSLEQKAPPATVAAPASSH